LELICAVQDNCRGFLVMFDAECGCDAISLGEVGGIRELRKCAKRLGTMK
jgi:hypothetical protein